MAAPKKTSLFSRLRGFRSRKNGPSSRRASNAKKAFKSSADHECSRAARKCTPLPPYFTVDDLAAFRRKRVPPKYRDTLRPLSGSLADVRTEYCSAYRSFVVAPDDSIVNWKKKKMKTRDCASAPEESEPDLPAGQYVRHPRTRSFRPVDNLRGGIDDEGGAIACNASSEAKDKYVAFAQVKPALLLRQSTHLKIDGEFEGASETKAQFKAPAGVRAPLQRRDTQLQLEGDMQLASENSASFVRFESAQRARLQRRHTTLELSADDNADCASEYHHAFHYPEHYERAHLMRSLENLRTEGAMQLLPEYASSFVDFQAEYPQIKYRERRRSLVEACRERHQQQSEVKATIGEGATRPSYSPEYRHSYVRFSAHRPVLQRPHSNLVPPSGIGETESMLESQLRQVWLPKSAGAPRPATTPKAGGGNAGGGADRLRSPSREQPPEGDENWREKPFCVLPEVGSEGARKNVNFTEDIISRPSESAFRKGKRLPVAKSSSPPRNSQSPTSETTGSQRPTFRLEVTNPDHQQRAFEKQRPGNATFVVLDENNNTNQWIKNKKEKRWVPSWMKY